MSGGIKVLGWIVVAVILAVLVGASGGDPGLREGAKGSYLGRAAKDTQISSNQVTDLRNRAATTQRY
ncbi:MAG: hypothetical protein ACT4P2_02955 [Pseudomonadota bacterium]